LEIHNEIYENLEVIPEFNENLGKGGYIRIYQNLIAIDIYIALVFLVEVWI